MIAASKPVATVQLPAVAWKNGGGYTRTLAVEPPGAGLDDFLWRVSIAEVAASGPFSSFPGVDRTIVLLEGDGMTLAGDDGPAFALTTRFTPYSFRGEARIEAKLAGGPSRDFNVMVRRGSAQATVTCLDNPAALPDALYDGVLYCARGGFRIGQTALSAGWMLRARGLAGASIVPLSVDSLLISVCIGLARPESKS